MKTVTTREELGHLVGVARRVVGSWRLIGLVVFLGTAVALTTAMVRQRVYRSETLMLYREGIRSSDLLGGDAGGDPARKLGMKLREKVLSRTSLQQVIEEFHLYPEIVEERGYVDAVDEMRARISFRIRDGDTFGLSFEGTAPRQVQAVTARLAEALVRDNSSNRLEQANTTKQFLDEERKKSESDLRTREMALARFLAAHPEFAREAVIGPGAASPVEAKTPGRPSTDPTLTALAREAKRIEKQLGAPTLGVKKVAEPVAPPPPDPARVLAEAEVKSARQELESRMALFTDQHPDVLAARVRLNALEAKVRSLRNIERAAAAATLQSQDAAVDEPAPLVNREELTAALARIRNEMASYRGTGGATQQGSSIAEANRLVALETESTRLNREVAEAREWQRQVTDRQFRADITASSVASGQNAQMEILDPAYLPTHPVKGGRTLVVLIGFFISVALGLCAAMVSAVLDGRIHDRFDLDRLGVGEVLATIPREPRTRWRVRHG